MVCPATDSVPIRAAPELDATLNETVPLAVPLLAPLIEIHDALLLADQLHLSDEVTDTEFAFEPAATIRKFCGAAVYVQLTVGGNCGSGCGFGWGGGWGWGWGWESGLPSCVMRTVPSAMTIEAVRAPPSLEAMVNATLPGPVPEALVPSATHASVD